MASTSRYVTAAIAVVAAYLHVASACFTVIALSRGASLCDHYKHCLQLKSDSHDSRKEENIQEEEVDPIRRRRRRNLEHWGVEHLASPAFPSTFEEVADEVFHAISGTVSGLQRPDPNVASNAMHQSVLDYRPTHPSWVSKRRWVNGDDSDVRGKQTSRKEEGIPARMGIEIDRAAYLLEKSNDEGRAMRILSLQIAKRLSTLPWDEMESSVGPRSVAVYFNSVEQSLLASRELSRLKEEEHNADHVSLGRIHIQSLSQDSLPSSMVKGKAQRNQSSTDSGESIILIVKPTDYNADSLIPINGDFQSDHQPTIQANIVDKLQSLLFKASASSIPAVVLSPRLSELPPLQQSSVEAYKRTGPSGFEQSGFQKSSTYGGIEPPVGPTSWLLRDLVPPVYVWVGRATTIGQSKHSRRSLRSIAASFRQQQYDAAIDKDEDSIDDFGIENSYSYYSRVVLKQSSMEAGHSWHMFAVKERLNPLHSSSTSRTMLASYTMDQVERHVSYHYMGSSNASRGRPSTRIMSDVFEEFCENSSSAE
mmetsp:Transcript_31674/g.66605  ORF Transcript_31674/g.66605 Transcript_31674/m.66605 type:complete len:536 (-) Transcript_31674:52-1659(-)|eukprot:CAMPEP_0172313364 /NCGR_PEP_ID=MMETSP1058-20130122/20133_1 /TAXON_ID=83371 /ORGANISM="Detonula confervacea, Strain CCMP 353" /LENGTH=535 /DNA_ID=CAMNT_0013027009 /DNA_START=124 /DNA_END=1731 /DNA_ORIENTATION=-